MARIRAQRLPGSGTRTLGPVEALYGVAFPLYDRTDVAGSGRRARARPAGATAHCCCASSTPYINRNPDGTYGNEQEANTADQLPRHAVADRPGGAASRRRPRPPRPPPSSGVADLYGGLTCVFWPVPATGHPHAIRAAGLAANRGRRQHRRPGHALRQAQALAAELQHGVLITRVGDGHTGYRSSACVRQAVDAYLIDLTVPANGTTCPSP